MDRGLHINKLVEQHYEQIKLMISSDSEIACNTIKNSKQLNNEKKNILEKKIKKDRPHVLLVDDEAFNLEIEQEVLTAMNCKVDTTTSGKHALELVKDNFYDLIFMDCYMSDPDGFETTRRIRAQEHGRRITIIGVTASLLEEDREQAYKSGMDEFIIRPLSIEKLKLYIGSTNDH